MSKAANALPMPEFAPVTTATGMFCGLVIESAFGFAGNTRRRLRRERKKESVRRINPKGLQVK
jgi:hypothetical protein